jgi:hypothetical protein
VCAEELLATAIPFLVGTVGCASRPRHLALKFAAWNIRLAPLLAATFPATPMIFLYRPGST